MRDFIAYRTVAIFAFAAVLGCTLAACAPQPGLWEMRPITHPDNSQ